jgi:hypothetical protein
MPVVFDFKTSCEGVVLGLPIFTKNNGDGGQPSNFGDV